MKEKIKNLSGKLAVGYLAASDDLITPLKPGEGSVFEPKTAVENIVSYALFFVGIIALVFVLYGGITYIMSGGDAEKTTKARNTIMYAVLGIVIVVLAYLIVQWAGGSGAGEVLTPVAS